MRRIRKYKKIFTQGIKLIKYIYYLIYSKIFKNKVSIYKNIWLISERGIDARDNGYFFYKYMVNNHKEIDIRYIISIDSPDFNKIRKLGKYIVYGSKEHYIAFITSKMLISAHLMGFSPDMGLFMRLQKYHLLKLNGKLVMLQHGITKDYLTFWKPNIINLSLLISGAKPEYDYFISKYGFNKDVVKLTGFSRFDNLEKIKSNNILFMPTHRIYLHNMNDKEFIETIYYKNINSLLNNKYLNKLLNDNNLNLLFYVHYEFQKYSHLFNTGSNRIKILNICECDIQNLLINSCLLITDYSSVFFDYAYMEKPVIYYQFDYDDFRNGHYEEGYFSYSKDGFGKVLDNELDLLKEIKLNINNNFNLDKKYINKINKYFLVRDKNNNKRIYEEIMKIRGN